MTVETEDFVPAQVVQSPQRVKTRGNSLSASHILLIVMSLQHHFHDIKIVFVLTVST